MKMMIIRSSPSGWLASNDKLMELTNSTKLDC